MGVAFFFFLSHSLEEKNLSAQDQAELEDMNRKNGQ
jgi:hypothetical protein